MTLSQFVYMAAASCLLTVDQLLCPICLDVFSDPVTTSCAHNCCKNCTTQHKEKDVPCKCHMFKKISYKIPVYLSRDRNFSGKNSAS